jgi:hypothetical protein
MLFMLFKYFVDSFVEHNHPIKVPWPAPCDMEESVRRRKSSLLDPNGVMSAELVMVHRTSSPFIPPIPQTSTSVCSVHTQTYYSVAPVQVDPGEYSTTGGLLCMSHSSLMGSSFETVCGLTESAPLGVDSEEDDRSASWCGCCLP